MQNCEVHSFIFSYPSSTSTTTAANATATAATSAAATGASIVAGGEEIESSRPRVEAYLAGQGLALACALGMPLQAVAHVSCVVRYFSGGAGGGRGGVVGEVSGGGGGPLGSRDGGRGAGEGPLRLNQTQMAMLLGHCGMGIQETKWLFVGLDRERAGVVSAKDFLHALMVFYPGERGGGGGAAAAAALGKGGIADLRSWYQREVSCEGGGGRGSVEICLS